MLRILGFETRYKKDGTAVDWVEYTSRDAITETGSYTHTTSARVSDLRPPEEIDNDNAGLRMAAMQARWAQIGPAYEAWKTGQELPEDGTPLGAWSGVTPGQAKALRDIGIATVEAVRDLPESVIAKPPFPGLRDLKRLAHDWLEGRSLAAVTAENASLRERMEAMEAMLAEQMTAKPAPRRAKEQEAA